MYFPVLGMDQVNETESIPAKDRLVQSLREIFYLLTEGSYTFKTINVLICQKQFQTLPI